MAFPEDIVSSTPERYIMKLVSETDSIICNPIALEWKAGSLEMKRDLESGGVMVSFLCDSLTFVGNGATFLKNLFANAEVNAKCTLQIYRWQWSTRSYVEFPSKFDINFNFFEIVKVGRFFFGVRVKAINSSTQTKLDNRIDVDVDITKLVSVGGVTINGYGTNDANLNKFIDYSETYVAYPALLQDLIGSYRLIHKIHIITYTSVPIKKINSELREVQDVSYLTGISNLKLIPSFFANSEIDRTLTIHYQFQMRVSERYWPGAEEPYRVQILEVDPDGVIISGPYIDEGFGRDARTYIYNDSIDVSVSAGNDLKCVVMSEGIDSSYDAYSEYSVLSVVETVSQSPAVTTEGFPIYETIERLCQLILDCRYPIYSDFFGRTDIEYRPGVFYSAENVDRFAHIQGGMNLRGATINNADAPIAMNFKSLMKSLKALWNIGYSLEVNPTLFGDSNPRIRIEEYSYFFENEKINFDPPLSERITKYDIQSQVMPELVPVDLKSGFESFEYLSINGRSEPNTTAQRTSVMNTATKFEVISWLRGDTKGIFDNISNPIGGNGSTDTKGDNSVFIIKTRKHPTITGHWIPETDQVITVLNESSLFKNFLLNRYFTPARMLIRHGNRLTAGMQKQLTSVLRFQKSDKLCSLETSDDVGVTSLFENQDILVSSLAAPIFKAMKHTAIIPEWTFADQALVELYPNKYWSFGIGLDGKEITGYLLPLKKKNAEDKVEVSIIERYVAPI